MYNLAQNNSAYHTGLTDVYMAQIELLKTSENPIAEDKIQELQAGINKTKEVMDNIGGLHAKIRDNYLNIIDSSKISEMKENNEIATQALKTMLTYTKQLDEDIIANIDLFRAVLGINARDYDEYMVYPPETIEEIDVTKPTVKREEEQFLLPRQVLQTYVLPNLKRRPPRRKKLRTGLQNSKKNSLLLRPGNRPLNLFRRQIPDIQTFPTQ